MELQGGDEERTAWPTILGVGMMSTWRRPEERGADRQEKVQGGK